MGRKRNARADLFQHIYQITCDKGIVFCNVADCILLFTLICTYAVKCRAKIIALTIMFNHFHIEASFPTAESMSAFMNKVTSVFARVYNHHYGLKGQLFHKPFGSSLKSRDSRIFDNVIYIANNALEKKAVALSADYRWNFLKYMVNNHPFSDEYDPYSASKEMQYLINKVKKLHSRGEYIAYGLFDSGEYKSLCDKEKAQLVDMIINKYNVIDYRFILRRYGSFDKFCDVLSNIGGTEYDIGDDSDYEDYKHYYKMIRIAEEEGYKMSEKRYVGIGSGDGKLAPEMYRRIVKRFEKEVNASPKEIAKFFHYYPKSGA